MSNITTTPDTSPKVTIGQATVSIRLKLETKLIKLSKLLDGISNKAEFKKTSELIKLNQDFSTLPDSFLIASEAITPSRDQSHLDSKELMIISLWPLKIHSMTTSTMDIKDTLNKETIQKELLLL